MPLFDSVRSRVVALAHKLGAMEAYVRGDGREFVILGAEWDLDACAEAAALSVELQREFEPKFRFLIKGAYLPFTDKDPARGYTRVFGRTTESSARSRRTRAACSMTTSPPNTIGEPLSSEVFVRCTSAAPRSADARICDSFSRSSLGSAFTSGITRFIAAATAFGSVGVGPFLTMVE